MKQVIWNGSVLKRCDECLFFQEDYAGLWCCNDESKGGRVIYSFDYIDPRCPLPDVEVQEKGRDDET